MSVSRGSAQILDYWRILVSRRWTVYLCVITVTVIALVGSFLATPTYRSTVTLQIERQNPDIFTFRDLSSVDRSWVAYTDFYQTQYRIISSPAVARMAVDKLGLESHPLFERDTSKPSLLSRTKSMLRSLLPSRNKSVPLDPVDIAAAQLMGQLEVKPVRNSYLVAISAVSPEPELAAEVANAVADAYVEYNIESQFSTSRNAKDFLLNQISALKDEVARDEAALQDYSELKNIISIDDNNNLTMKALQGIADRLTEVQTERARAEATYRSVTEAPPEALPEVLSSGLIQNLRREYAAYETELTQKSAHFKGDWPEMKLLRSKLDKARERLELEIDNIAKQVRANAEAEFLKAKTEEDNLERLLQEQEDLAQKLRRDSVEYANLRSEVTEKRETLDRLIKRQNEVSLSARLKDIDSSSTNIRIMDRAKPAPAPFRPNTKVNLTLALVMGLMLGVSGAYLLDYLDNTVKSISDLEKVTDLPLLAVIHRHEGLSAPRSRSRRKLSAADASGPFDMITYEDSRAAASEAYRELRTALLLSHAGQPPRQIMITSAMPQEGKSATNINLAIVLAQLDRKVLLVDTDLRRPRLHTALKIDNRVGVSTYLSGLENNVSKVVQPSPVEGLFLLPSGPIPPNPSELLNSPRFEQMGRELLAQGFDHVIYDSPPVLSVADPVIIASVVDSVILVVRASSTPRQSVSLAVERLAKAGRGTTGVVLNDLDLESRGSNYYRYYYTSGPDTPRLEPPETPRKQAGGNLA